MATVACAYVVSVILDLNKKSHLVKLFNDLLTCFVTVKTVKLAAVFVDGGIIVKDIDLGKIVALSYLKVIRVMRGCDLNNTCSEGHVNIAVGNDRDLSVYERKPECLSNKILVSFIFGINSHGGITEHCLGTCCGEDEEFLF